MKNIFFTTALMLLFSSCGSNEGSKEGIYGEIPRIFTNEVKGISAEVKSIQQEAEKESNDGKALEKALSAMGLLQGAIQEATTKSAQIAEDMKGKEIRNSVSEKAPYKVESFNVVNVKLPEFSLKGMSDFILRSDVKFVLTDTIKDRNLIAYYAISNGSEDFYCGRMVVSHPRIVILNTNPIMLPGDTLTTEYDLKTPDIPVALIEECNIIRFIDKEEYETVKSTVDAKADQWKAEAKKDWE